jgi:hypothetical protein
MNDFWTWLSNGQNNTPTLMGRASINAIAIEDSLFIIAGNGSPQPPISRDTAERYIQEYLNSSGSPIKGNKRYVIALYIQWVKPKYK